MIEHQVLELLRDHGQQSAGDVGAIIWRHRKRGRIISSNGGGDYAAQMLLGRMRKKGLVRVASGAGSSQWEITPAGRQKLKEG